MDRQKFDKADLKIRELVKLVTVDSSIKFIREDLCEKYDELLLKYATELIDAANDKSKKSEMACNCCAEEIEAQQKMLAMVEAVDAFTTAINKLANK